MGSEQQKISPMMNKLAAYMAGALRRPLPANVVEKTQHHIADTLAAILSGSRLLPGEQAIRYVATQGGNKEATVMGTRLRTSAVNAAFANAMSAHADETDDSHQAGFFHPGCGIVPAAWAMAECTGASGRELVRAVALGYDVGARVNMALGGVKFSLAAHSAHTFGALFGAAAAAGAAGLGRGQLSAEGAPLAYAYGGNPLEGLPVWLLTAGEDRRVR